MTIQMQVIVDNQLELGSPFRFAGNDLKTLSWSSDLATRQAVADQLSAPQKDFGSLLAVLEGNQ